jgi:hypothetical protein
MIKVPIRIIILSLVMIPAIFATAIAGSNPTADPEASGVKPVVQLFYKVQPPSLQTHEKIRSFLAVFEDEYEIQDLLMTEPANAKLMHALGLPTEHFPFGLAIDGKTSANIDGATIIFARFPDFMHHIGRHQGNWSLAHLETVLKNPELLLPENPVLESNPGGGKKPEDRG